MKLILRILVLLLSIAIWVLVFLPPSEELVPFGRPQDPTAASPTATPAPAHSLVTDLLGGQQIRAGQKAREQLDQIKTRRDTELQELE